VATFTGFWTNAAIYYGTDRNIGVIDEAPFLQNLQDMTLWGSGNPVPNSETQMSVNGNPGRVGEILVDPRFNPTDGHSWIYVTDPENGALHIVGSRDSRIVHSWMDLPDPTGLAIRKDGTRLYVTNMSNDTMSALDIGQTTVGTRGVTDVTKGLSSPKKRVDVAVGRGPRGLAHAPDGDWIVVANSLDATVTTINSATLVVQDVLHVGGNPTDVAMTWFYVAPPYQIGRFAYVTCKGSSEIDGTISFLWLSALSIPPLVTPSGRWQVQSTLTDFGSPEGIVFDYGRAAWFADSAANEAVKVSWEFQGIAIISPLPILQSRVPVGNNPTDVALEPWVYYRTNGQVLPYTAITACRGSGELRFIDNNQPARPQFTMKIPKVAQVASILDQ
jgi:DNA-binding beta-propeller fold protein YncE